MPRPKKVKVEEGVASPEPKAVDNGLAEAERLLQEAENVRTFLNNYDVHRSSQLDNLIARAKADVDAKKQA